MPLILLYFLEAQHVSGITMPVPSTLLQPAAPNENNQCGNQQHSRELLTMGTVVPETC